MQRAAPCAGVAIASAAARRLTATARGSSSGAPLAPLPGAFVQRRRAASATEAPVAASARSAPLEAGQATLGPRLLALDVASSEWKRALQDPHLRTVGSWGQLPTTEVAKHLAGVAALSGWWEAARRACPLVVSPVAERAICVVRLHLVKLLAESPDTLPQESEQQLLHLATALAAQARQSEHAYSCSDEELRWAGQLRKALEQEPSSSGSAWRAVIEAVLPAFPGGGDSTGSRVDAADVGSDAAVRSFYERHPIPQWLEVMPWSRPELLAEPIRTAGEGGKRVLVAGCGTGRWACTFAATFPRASVLATDWSEASLRYAEERRREAGGLENLSFVQADLTQWTSEEQFDFIECGGVLHHLEDPVSTWTRLAATLRPGGTMLVSLYSRRARKPLKELKKKILPKMTSRFASLRDTQQPSDDILRAFRQELLAETWASELLPLARSPDLHSLSRLRDCFFHPLEHEYDLLEISEMLRCVGLRFVGIDDQELVGWLRRLQPGRRVDDLAAWHELEAKMPEIFIGMYGLLLEKPLPS